MGREIDTDGSNTITYWEFTVAAYYEPKILNQQQKDIMYDLFGEDCDGEITMNKFIEGMKGEDSAIESICCIEYEDCKTDSGAVHLFGSSIIAIMTILFF